QKDPLIEYKQEAFDMFVDLMHDIRATFTERLFKFQVEISAGPPERAPAATGPRRAPARPSRPPQPVSDSDLLVSGAAAPAPAATATTELPERGAVNLPRPRDAAGTLPKVGRNDPCPCGSGKKYKKCHGVNA
ncbi:MAG: SEC-C domain-containing protein, partial [Gemmatimonadetes bacterium]|nr:SEC-C domain-containing protein [Gemmatimonadota bacterium]